MLKLKKQRAEEIEDFPAFYHANERLIRGTLFHLVGANDLDDLVQQAFIRCWESRDKFEGRSRASTWITSIALHLAYDHLRKRKLPLGAVDVSQMPGVVDEGELAVAVRKETRQTIEAALAGLSFDHRTVIVLMYFQDLSLEEISEATGDPVGTVKSRLHYAKAELRKLLTAMGIEI